MNRPFGAVAIILTMAASPCAWAAGDPDVGLSLAARWCSSCHADNEAASASDAAQSLQHIARSRAGQSAWLRGWLTSPHPPMPNLNLSRAEIDDVIAYLQRLATAQ